jgi:hypothetical protein
MPSLSYSLPIGIPLSLPHYLERCLALEAYHMINVITSVIIGARPIQQGVVSQSLGVT